MPVDPAHAKSLFLAAVDLPATERAAFLDRECAGDPELRARVEALLHADEPKPSDATAAFEPSLATGDYQPNEATGTFGDDTRTHEPGTGSRMATTVGTVIAKRYNLLELIGEGGMGSVYLATQSEPVKRQVALKLIKTGMDSKGVLARFNAERQALAMMDHPNIARIYDGGVTAHGQPFFVMELVQGVPLTEYCDTKRLTVDARLQLFVQICQAVQHAHQKGIIHRDLKPANVLVTEVDGRPTPKVIDFGVAKATEQKLTDLSFSDTGAIVGTPAYMSPEQADPSSMDIDTRTDVYALGVILYELLTGSPPIDAKQFKRGAILEMLRMVREVEPPRPSTKLSTADALPNIAANRNIEPSRLAKLLQGELDWVVMKALEKDRTRRYETANGLARDVQRYLADEVVEARPPSRGYRLKKFVKRNKGQVIAASLVLCTLLGGVIGTGYGLVRAERARAAEADQRRLAEIKEQEANTEREIAESKRREALQSAEEADRAQKRAEAVTRFLTTNLLGQADPAENPVGDRLTVRELLDRAAGEFERANLPPEVEARLRAVVGKTYAGLSLDNLAEPHLRKALTLAQQIDGPLADLTIDITNDLAFVLRAIDKSAEAEELSKKLFDQIKETRVATDEKLLDVKNSLAVIYQDAGRIEEAVKILREVLKASEASSKPDSDTVLISALNLVTALRHMNALTEAEELLRSRLPLMKKHWAKKPGLYIAYNELGLLLEEQGNFSEAEEYFQKILSEAPAVVGPKSDIVLNARNNLALVLTNLGRHRDAEREYRQVTAIESELPISERSKLLTLFNLGLAVYRQDRVNESLSIFRSVRQRLALVVVPSHPDLLHVTGVLTEAENAAGNATTAEALSRENIQLALQSGEVNTQQKANSFRIDLGWALLHQGRSIEAEEAFAAVVKSYHQNDPNGRHLSDAESALGFALLAQKRYIAAEPHLVAGFRGLLRLFDEIPPRARHHVDEAANRLALLYRLRGQSKAAAQILQERKMAGPSTHVPAASRVLVSRVLMNAGEYVEAEAYVREGLAIQEKVEPDSEITAGTRLLLGTLLLKLQKYAEAEPPLIKGYEGMKAYEKTIPPQGAVLIPEALDRLIELYTATKKPDEVKKYRELRAKYPNIAPMPREKK